MGSSYVNTLVACDSSFMIQSLKEFHIPGIDYTFSINTTHVAMLLVSVFIIIMAIVARVKINKVKPDDTPGMFQNAIEIIVEMLGTMVDGIMGKNANMKCCKYRIYNSCQKSYGTPHCIRNQCNYYNLTKYKIY